MYKKCLFPIFSICAVFFITSCTSTGFLGVLTTNKILEERLAESEMKADEKIRELREMVSNVQSDVKEIQELTGKLNEMIDIVDETSATTKELQQLARNIEKRMDNLPRKTLKEMVKILDEML